jgi:hypothetical protein
MKKHAMWGDHGLPYFQTISLGAMMTDHTVIQRWMKTLNPRFWVHFCLFHTQGSVDSRKLHRTSPSSDTTRNRNRFDGVPPGLILLVVTYPIGTPDKDRTNKSIPATSNNTMSLCRTSMDIPVYQSSWRIMQRIVGNLALKKKRPRFLGYPLYRLYNWIITPLTTF